MALALLAVAPAPAAAKRSVPPQWIGVTVGPELLSRPDLVPREVGIMRSSGVERVRANFDWAFAQPYRSAASVPPRLRGRFRTRGRGGVPTDFSALDRLVGAAAQHRLTVLPVVVGAPRWASNDRGKPASDGRIAILRPRDPADYARFLGTLIDRYGPRGGFWRAHPKLPRRSIRAWQVWNEPDFAAFWGGADFRPSTWPAEYVRLLRPARDAIKAADPGATAVLAGVTATRGYTPWQELGLLYGAGARGLFDQAAVHIYTQRPPDVVRALQLSRDVMIKNGDAGRSIILTEFGWTAAAGRAKDYGWNVTDQGLATRVRQVLPALARARGRLRLAGVFWYTWLSSYRDPRETFAYAGLRSLRARRPESTPALAAFRSAALRLEGRKR